MNEINGNKLDLKKLINDSNNILVLTGAGISTDSGIPDFRSKKGLYEHEPEEIISHNFFSKNPKEFYDFFKENLYFPMAEPNEGHAFIAQLEKAGKIEHIITQNIDGLHQKAGNEKVIEFHGNTKKAFCSNPKCKKEYLIEDILKIAKQNENIDYWICDCNAHKLRKIIKPDIVLYGDKGEWMSNKKMRQIRKMVWNSDLLLVLGTTLKVFPFRTIIEYRKKTTPLVIINRGETPFDNDINVLKFNESISDIFDEL